MAHLQTRRFGKPELMDIFLKGGITGRFQVQPQVWGLHGLTLVFTSPSAKTVAFSAPNSAPLTPGEIIQQISNTFNDPAETTEGGTALSGITMAGETLTLYLDEKSDPASVLFGTESGEAPILAVLNAALNPLGVTATAGGAGGVVLTTDDAGHSKSIRVAATGGGQATLDMTVETKTGVTNVAARFHDGLLTLVEGAPATGVALDGATSTAAQYFGFSDKAVAGTVYAAPDGSVPRFINFAPSGQMDGIIVMTEEA